MLAVTIPAQDFILENDMRLKEDKFYYQHTDLTYLYKINDLFSPFTGYRFINEIKGGWKHYHRFHVGIKSKQETPIGSFSMRNRSEYTPNDDIRHRTRLKYSPLSFGKKYITSLYIFDEVFIDLNDSVSYTRNRLGGGFETKFSKKWSASLYYFAEFKKKDSWRHKDIVGIYMKYKFK